MASVDKMLVLMNKGLTMRAGQMHGQKYMHKLLDLILNEQLDPSLLLPITTARTSAPRLQDFQQKEDNCVKVVLKPISKRQERRGKEASKHNLPSLLSLTCCCFEEYSSKKKCSLLTNSWKQFVGTALTMYGSIQYPILKSSTAWCNY